MDIEEQLKQFGLNKSETKVYLYVLEEGLSTPPRIARGTGIARTNSYNILETLKDKGLIEMQKRGKRNAYIAADPEALVRAIETKKNAMKRLLPDLRALYTIQKNKPKIRFYDGWEQVKEIYWQTYQAKEIYAIGSTKHLTMLQKDFFEKFVSGLKQKGVVLNDILSAESGEEVSMQTKETLKGLYDFAVIPKQFQNFQTDILIWGNNIALITLEEPIFGTVLTNPLLAETFRTMFKVMRLGLKH